MPAQWHIRYWRLILDSAGLLENLTAASISGARVSGSASYPLHKDARWRENIGVCGRSGSGKSSLLLTLLLLLDPSSGTMEVDDVDLSTLSRQTIRERLTALPQEAMTFPGTLRQSRSTWYSISRTMRARVTDGGSVRSPSNGRGS